jgi:iron complex transport system ATP-binding protein
MVLHGLNLAARYSDHLIAIENGRIHGSGGPAEVLTEDCVRAVFGIESRVIIDPVSAKPLMLRSGGATSRLRERGGLRALPSGYAIAFS